MNFYANFNWFRNIIGGGGVLIILIVLSLIVVGIIANWKIFKKAGRNGWESLIPIYSSWILIEIAGLNWWWFLLLVIDVAFKIEIDRLTMAINVCGFLANFNCHYNIARRFGKDKTISILAGLFPFIFMLIFAFSKNDVYDINIPVSINGIFGLNDNDTNHQINDENVEQSTTFVDKDDNAREEYSYCGNCGLKLDKDVKFCPNCGKEKK